MKFGERSFLRSALIIGYILAVLLFAGLARAKVNGSFDASSFGELQRIVRTA